MSDSHTTPEAAILVAVDIAKDHNEVLIELRKRRDRHRRFRVANTLEECNRLVAYLRQLDAPALIGFEATGNYHRPLAYFLRAGLRAAVDSPLLRLTKGGTMRYQPIRASAAAWLHPLALSQGRAPRHTGRLTGTVLIRA